MHATARYESAPQEPPDPDEIRYLIEGAKAVIGQLARAGGPDERHVVMLEGHLPAGAHLPIFSWKTLLDEAAEPGV